MKSFCVSFLVCSYVFSSMLSYAAHLPLTRNDHGIVNVKAKRINFDVGGSINLLNVQNIRYVINITVNGLEIPVALDTGSTDLWVHPPGGLGNFNDTNVPLALNYGSGSVGANGTIGIAPVQVGPYTIEHQAFLNANSVTLGALEGLGIYGLLGLGFDFATQSPIIGKIQTLYGSSGSLGASVLNNTFSQNPHLPRVIAFDLTRSDDSGSSEIGSFTIGEVEPNYGVIEMAPAIPVFPPLPVGSRWSAIVDDVQISGRSITLSSGVMGTPQGKVVALLDTGNPTGSLPGDLLDSIYSAFEGAVKFVQKGIWIVPCVTPSPPILVLTFGEQEIPIHPLDMTTISTFMANGKYYTGCISSFTADRSLRSHPGQYDIALGDTFLRNVYSLYDFGNTLQDGSPGSANIRMLPKTDVSKAVEDYVSSRQKALKNHSAPEIAPMELLSLMFA